MISNQYGYLQPEWIGLHVFSDALMVLTCGFIALTLFYLVRRRQDLPFTWVFLLFSLFILSCGISYLMEIWTLWHPAYWLTKGINLFTASVSVSTAISLGTIVPKALDLPSPAQYEIANWALRQEVAKRQRIEAEHEQAKAAIQRSEARYRAIVEDQTELIARFQPDGTLTFVNEVYCRYFGVKQEDLIGHHYEPVVFPDDRERVAQLVRSMTQANPTVVIENRVIVGEEVRWTQWANRAMFDRQGGLLEFQAVGRDISDLKQAEENLRHSEERLQLALEASGDGLWDWNIQTGEIYYNPRYFEMLGYQADELPHEVSTWEWLVHPDDMVWVKEMLAAHLQESSASYKFDYRLRTKSGEWRWVADYGKVVARDQQGNPLRMLGTHRDVDYRKRAEEALRRYERIVSATTDAIVLLDRNYIYQVVNQSYLNWYNKPLDEVVGHSVSNIMPPTVFESIIKPRLDQCMAGQVIQYEMWVEYPTMGPQFLSITYDPYIDANQAISGVVVSLRNITKLKQAEEQIKASLREKEVLLQEIHHRVKNNLGIVDGLLQMQARRSPDPQLTETLKESRNRIASIALVHEKLYRSEDLANINFAYYIPDLTAHLFDSYNMRSSQIKLSTQVDDVTLDIDTAIPCGLIINELVSNALKYAFPGDRAGEIHVNFCRNADGTITLAVQDNGIGLPRDFDVNQTKTLGMKLIQGLVKQLKGTLEVNSQKGAIFKVTINSKFVA